LSGAYRPQENGAGPRYGIGADDQEIHELPEDERLLVAGITVGKRHEDGGTEIRTTYRFVPPGLRQEPTAKIRLWVV
jgi:hypothetical protein